MSLTRVNYVDGTTIIGAQNLNDIQDAILANEDNIGDITPLAGASDPTTATVGAVKQLYLNTTSNKLFICTAVSSGTYTWVKISSDEATWGNITGTLANQTDLQTALNAKVDKTTTVNGNALSSNVVLDGADINVDDTATTPRTIKDAIETIESDVDDLETTVGDSSSGLVKAVADNTDSIEELDDNKVGITAQTFTSAQKAIARRNIGAATIIKDDFTFAQIQQIVNAMAHKDYFSIGDQIVDKWKKDASTEYSAPWDVAHMTDDKMYLNWHYCIPDGVQFDAPEAIYYAPSSGLAAGTYYIAIGTAYGTGWTTDKNIQFTLASALDADDQIFIDCGTNNANDPTAGRALRVYSKGGTTVKQTTTTSNGTDGTLLGTIGATNAHKPEGNINAISRVVYGYARWSQSAIRQYLNSAEAAGSWWTAQNGWDRPPAQHTTIRGFLAGCSDDFIATIQAQSIVTALNTQEGLPTSETTQDKIFLPSLQEMYIATQIANVEGVDWDYNKTLAQEAGLSGRFAQYGTYEILKKYSVAATTSSCIVWLRSCYRGYANSAWYVGSSGNVNYASACYAFRGCPACIIQSEE